MIGSSNSRKPCISNSSDCESVVIITNLASPDSEVLKHHSIGDELIVNLKDDIVMVRNHDGEILGSIIHKELYLQIEYLLTSKMYMAKILDLSENSCRVRISKIN